MKLEIKKIEKKVELDTRVEGCWSDCWDGVSYKYTAYNKSLYEEGIGECVKSKKTTAKTCWIW